MDNSLQEYNRNFAVKLDGEGDIRNSLLGPKIHYMILTVLTQGDEKKT